MNAREYREQRNRLYDALLEIRREAQAVGATRIESIANSVILSIRKR